MYIVYICYIYRPEAAICVADGLLGIRIAGCACGGRLANIYVYIYMNRVLGTFY